MRIIIYLKIQLTGNWLGRIHTTARTLTTSSNWFTEINEEINLIYHYQNNEHNDSEIIITITKIPLKMIIRYSIFDKEVIRNLWIPRSLHNLGNVFQVSWDRQTMWVRFARAEGAGYDQGSAFGIQIPTIPTKSRSVSRN